MSNQLLIIGYRLRAEHPDCALLTAYGQIVTPHGTNALSLSQRSFSLKGCSDDDETAVIGQNSARFKQSAAKIGFQTLGLFCFYRELDDNGILACISEIGIAAGTFANADPTNTILKSLCNAAVITNAGNAACAAGLQCHRNGGTAAAENSCVLAAASRQEGNNSAYVAAQLAVLLGCRTLANTPEEVSSLRTAKHPEFNIRTFAVCSHTGIVADGRLKQST